MTEHDFTAGVTRAIRASNPDATDVRIHWHFGPSRVTWADGTDGWTGLVRVEATGYRTKVMNASTLDERITVR